MIYLAATIGYDLGTDDLEEIAYYNMYREVKDDMQKEPIKKGISPF